MLDKPETRDCHEILLDAVIQFRPRATDLVDVNIIVSPLVFKRHEENFHDFKGILQHAFRRDHHVVAQSISDKAIDLSNTATHELNADAFLGQSCAISAITTVHLVKLAYDRPDPK
jgi:hypothetical protein